MTEILVIEDEQGILENVKETLELEGFSVRGAPNGVIGVELARQAPPDLIICDIMMPELNGYEVLMKLRGDVRTANIPFMFLTARADKSDMRKGMELGADDYLFKPFTIDELLAAVDARIQRKGIADREGEDKLRRLRENIVRALPHELRTPLTGIIGYSEMLMIDYENFPRDQALNMIVAIYKSGMRLFRLIENYLMYAQLELAMLDKERIEALRRAKPLNLERTVSAAAMQAAQGQERSADLKLNIAQIEVRIAHDSLTKIVAELVDNSCKFSEPGTPVEVSAGLNGNVWQLIVRDYGRGIEPDQIKDIGAYMQFERALYEQQGMGLGLIISRRLAELHGGRLDIESEVNVGTVVTVTLPYETA